MFLLEKDKLLWRGAIRRVLHLRGGRLGRSVAAGWRQQDRVRRDRKPHQDRHV